MCVSTDQCLYVSISLPIISSGEQRNNTRLLLIMWVESYSNPRHPRPPLTVEITVISAQGLKESSTKSSFFSKRLKPFVTLTPTTLSSPWRPPEDDATHRTKIDSRGGKNPTWNETFRVTVQDSSFLYGASSSAVLLRVYADHRTLLGWCYVQVADIAQPLTGQVRFLSYRLRARDGTRSRGTIDLAVRLQGLLDPYPHQISDDQDRPAIGIPVCITSPDFMPLDNHSSISSHFRVLS